MSNLAATRRLRCLGHAWHQAPVLWSGSLSWVQHWVRHSRASPIACLCAAFHTIACSFPGHRNCLLKLKTAASSCQDARAKLCEQGRNEQSLDKPLHWHSDSPSRAPRVWVFVSPPERRAVLLPLSSSRVPAWCAAKAFGGAGIHNAHHAIFVLVLVQFRVLSNLGQNLFWTHWFSNSWLIQVF